MVCEIVEPYVDFHFERISFEKSKETQLFYLNQHKVAISTEKQRAP